MRPQRCGLQVPWPRTAITIGAVALLTGLACLPGLTAENQAAPLPAMQVDDVWVGDKNLWDVDAILVRLRAELAGPDKVAPLFIRRVENFVVVRGTADQVQAARMAIRNVAGCWRPAAMSSLRRREWPLKSDVNAADPKIVAETLTSLNALLTSGDDKQGAYLVLADDVVVMRCTDTEANVIVSALDPLRQPRRSEKPGEEDPKPPAGPGVWSIPVGDKDSGLVEQAVAKLASLATTSGQETDNQAGKADGGSDKATDAKTTGAAAATSKAKPFFLRAGDQVIVSGTDADHQLALRVLNALPRLVSRSFDLCVPPKSDVVTECLKQAGVTIYQQHGRTLHARASLEAMARLSTLLKERDLETWPETELVRLSHFRDPSSATRLLASSKALFAPDVDITPVGSDKERAGVILCGPKKQVDALRRRIAYADVTAPQMRLDLWSVQISGSNATEVAKEAKRARDAIEKTKGLMRIFLRVLDQYAGQVHGEAVSKQHEALSRHDGSMGSLPVILALMAMGLEDAQTSCPLWTGSTPGAQQLGKAYQKWLTAIKPRMPAERQASATQSSIHPDEAMTRLHPTALFMALGARPLRGSSLSKLLALQPKLDDPQEFEEITPEEIAVTFAGAQAELAAYEEALTSDVQRIFLKPLLEYLAFIAGKATSSGVAACGNTSISVLSGNQATVVGSAVSYFDVTQQPKLEADALKAALGGSPEAMANALLSLVPPDRVWSAMTEGAELTFTPVVAAGGALAEMDVKATITHADGGAQNGASSSSVVPLSRVAKHEATTKFNLQPLDLFEVSSFGLRTTHPRPDFVVPILGQIPFLGQMFRFPQGSRRVQHESLLVVYSTISPTALDLVNVLSAMKGKQEHAR